MQLPKTRAFRWQQRRLQLLDQRVLPHKVHWLTCRNWRDVANGIRDMVVRGAPAIGVCAAYGIVLAAIAQRTRPLDAARKQLEVAAEGLLKARPTAVNLRWALERMRGVWTAPHGSTQELIKALETDAKKIEAEDFAANQAMGRFGADLIPQQAVLLTHCNTGSLATAGLGTAFGAIWTAHRDGKVVKVLASETRPYLQGARLTAWELQKERIPFELITDNMAAHLMKTEKIDAVLVGADRIAANGDAANKIGTYSLAVLASYHHIPFYVVAPLSTVDLSTPNGEAIPIEERSVEEVTTIRGMQISPKGIKARHPAFDVTPAAFIAGIVTEAGVARAPYSDSLPRLFSRRSSSDPASVSRAAGPASTDRLQAIAH